MGLSLNVSGKQPKIVATEYTEDSFKCVGAHMILERMGCNLRPQMNQMTEVFYLFRL